MATHTQNATFNGVLAASVAGLVISVAVSIYALVLGKGHATFNTTSAGVIWGLPVASYVYFVLTSTGLTFVASLAMVFRLKAFYPIAKRCVWLAIATLVAGFLSLAIELGHPFRMLWAIPLGRQFSSPLNWMGTFYLLYLVLLVLKFRRIDSGDWNSAPSYRLGVASLVTVILAHGILGAAFGMLVMRPFWYGPLIPVYFLITAALSGAAFAILITYFAYGGQGAMPPQLRDLMRGAMPKVFAATLGVTLIATVSRVGSGLWPEFEGLEVWKHIIIATPWFWLEMAGLLVAFWLMVSPRMRNDGTMQVLAALLVAVALFIGRYEYVIGGQLLPMFKGAWNPGYINYAPSFTEWMITLLAVSLTFGIWAIGEKRLNLSAVPAESA